MASFTTFFLKYNTVILFVCLTVIILKQMLLPGYILTLDMVWADNLTWSPNTNSFTNTAPVHLFLGSLGLIFPSWLVQKFMLFGLFFSLMYIPYRFLPFIESNYGRLFAGMLYTLNPFVYARLLAGQWGVLLGYACFPLVLYTLNRLLNKRDLKSGLLYGLALTLVGSVSIHFLYLSVALSIVWIGAYMVKFLLYDRSSISRSLLASCLSGLLLFLLLSTYWLVPAFTRETPLETRFDAAHFEGFAASENHLVSTLLNLSVLGGFWAEGEEWRYYFIWPQDQVLFWVAAALILSLVAFGLLTLIRDSKRRFVGLLLLGIGTLSYILALGAWGGIFTSFNLWIYETISGWSGLRDSHKIAGVLALVYVTLAGIGVDRLVALSKKGPSWITTVLPIIFALPLLFGMYELFGFRGQLTPVDYPASWHEARQVLSATPDTEKMLVLPWQGYFSLPFNNQLIVSNPTSRFFGKEKVFAGRSVEVGDIYDQEADPTYRAWDTFLHEVPTLPLETIVDTLRQHDITYLFVIVNPEVEDQNLWLVPAITTPEASTSTDFVVDPKEANVIKALLQVPNQLLIDSDVILYRFTYSDM